MNWLLRVGLCGALALVSGCASPGSSGGGHGIAELHLFSYPVALRTGESPAPDGFAIKVFASRADDSKGVPITSGRLEVLLFDGALERPTATNAPLRTWTFSAAQLKPFAFQRTLGTGYDLALSWGEARPTSSKITVVTRYLPTKGDRVSSLPSVISVVLK